METLGERLKSLRGQTSQASFASSLGIPQMTLSNYETGKSEPKYSLINSICTNFSVNADWLLFGRGPMRPGEALAEWDHNQQLTVVSNECARCAKLEEKLEKVENQRDELAAENRRLWKENGELKERCARLEPRQKQDEAPPFDERRKIVGSSDALQIRA